MSRNDNQDHGYQKIIGRQATMWVLINLPVIFDNHVLDCHYLVWTIVVGQIGHFAVE